MDKNTITVAACVAALAGASAALADITVTQSAAPAPTYSTTLNFDEPGGPVGPVSTDAWASLGLIEMQAGDGAPVVGDFDAANGGWGLGDGNSFFGNFGVFMTFDTDLTEMSLQAWDPSGPPTPFGGGLAVVLFDDSVEVGSGFFTPAWGGVGDSWFNITTSGGMVFDEVRVLGFGFGPTTYADNISWNAVPAPGAGAALFGLCTLAARRRRR